MSKITNISGFPEWLPEQKIAENILIEKVRKIYESFGFLPIETPAAELLSTLAAKGVINKELYALKRVQASEDTEADLALHFDLTVPFARYVAQHFSELVFPFKRYQLQKVWRGDRPQKGRFREFYQFDVDIIAREELPLSCDAEIITILDQAFGVIGFGQHLIKLNNRKVLIGCYRSFGLTESAQKAAISIVDKLDKIGAQNVENELMQSAGVAAEIAKKIINLTTINMIGTAVHSELEKFKIEDELFNEGRAEILQVVDLLSDDTKGRVKVDLSLARGLEYYTGSIFEFQYPSFPEFGTLASGGRYQDLASEFINKKLPGVGGSIGLTRIMDLGFRNNLIHVAAKTTAPLLMTVLSEAQRRKANSVAAEFRTHGVGVEVFFKSPKLGKQIEYAETKRMSHVLFLDEANGLQIKNLRSKEQVDVGDVAAWCSAFLRH